MRRVVIIAAGGTLSMKRGPAVSGAVPPLKGEDLLAQLGREYAELAFQEFNNVPGSHFTPVTALELANRVESAVLAPDVDGVVITHGSDTLEETAYLLDLVLHSPKPIVVTSAIRSAATAGYDGLANLRAAIRTAAAPAAREAGTLVVMNDRIYAASEVQAQHSLGLDAFAAPESGPLGAVGGDRIWLLRKPAQRQHIPCARVEEMVDLIRIAQGADDRQLRHAIHDGAAGVVLEVFGSGRVPPWWLPALSEAVQRRVTLVVTSRNGSGGLYDDFGYVGAYHDLRRLGVIFAHHLNGLKARIKLMVALGAARHPEELRTWFNEAT